MKMWKVILPVTAVLLLAGQAAAQTDENERLREMEYVEEGYNRDIDRFVLLLDTVALRQRRSRGLE